MRRKRSQQRVVALAGLRVVPPPRVDGAEEDHGGRLAHQQQQSQQPLERSGPRRGRDGKLDDHESRLRRAVRLVAVGKVVHTATLSARVVHVDRAYL